MCEESPQFYHQDRQTLQGPVGSGNYNTLSYDVASGREITPCIKINKPLVVNRFSGSVMKLRFKRHAYQYGRTLTFSRQNMISK